MRKFVASLLTVTMVLCASVGILEAQADSEDECDRYYTSIEVHSGDTLEAICNDWYNKYDNANHYDSFDDFINEISRENSLTTDVIYPGHYLTVSYYR